jgi:AcrR family transcriptional regulator
VTAATELIGDAGPAGLALAAIAARFGVKAPSLYTHIGGIDALDAAVRLRALEQLDAALQRVAVGRSGSNALFAIARAYREFARAHPGQYALSLRATDQTPELAAVAQRILATITAVLRGYDLDDDDALHATRALRSALHGFVSLELAGGFAMDLDVEESYQRLIAMVDAGLSGI